VLRAKNVRSGRADRGSAVPVPHDSRVWEKRVVKGPCREVAERKPNCRTSLCLPRGPCVFRRTRRPGLFATRRKIGDRRRMLARAAAATLPGSGSGRNAFQVGNHFIEQGALRPEFCKYLRNVHVKCFSIPSIRLPRRLPVYQLCQ